MRVRNGAFPGRGHPFLETRKKQISTLQKSERRAGFGFLLPSFIVILCVVALPIIYSFIVSFYNYTFISPGFSSFAGIQNYLSILQDSYFWNSLWVTLKFVVLVVSIEFCIGFLIALMLSRDIRFKGFYYAILTIPMLMSPVAVGLIWKMLLHPSLGIINFILNRVGLSPIDWLGNSTNAFFTVIFVDIWQQVSFMILILLAGLVSLPKDIFEAADIDGASEVQKLYHIKIPLMGPVMFAAVTLRVLFAFRTFDLVYVLTRGGPGVATDVLSYYIYRQTFMGLDIGKASAGSFILLVIVIMLIYMMFKTVFRNQSVED